MTVDRAIYIFLQLTGSGLPNSTQTLFDCNYNSPDVDGNAVRLCFFLKKKKIFLMRIPK